MLPATLPGLLATFGALATLALGLLGFLAPARAAALVRLSARTHPGPAEFRATYGGLFIGLGLVPLLTGADAAYLAAGAAWSGAALGRVASLALDALGARALNPRNWLAVAFEGGIGLLCLAVLF